MVFPHAVLLLYTSDTALHLTRRAKTAAAATGVIAGGFDRPCTAARDFVKNSINSVFDAIGHIQTDHAAIDRLFGKGWFGDIIKGVGDVLSQSVNAVIDSARSIVIGVTEIPIQLITNAIAGVAGTVSVIGQVANSLLPWQGSLRAAPTTTSKGVGAGIPGTFTLDVTAPGSNLQWSPPIVDCAKAFSFDLPTFTPKDARVDWDITQAPGALIVTTTNTGRLNERGTAQQAYVTATETPEEAAGTPAVGYVNVIVKVHRDDLDKLIHAVTDGLMRLLPGLVRDALGPQILSVVTPLVESLTKNIDKVRDVQADAFLPVSYHQPKEPPKPPPPPTGIAGHWNGNWVGDGAGTFAADFTQSGDTFSGTIAIGGSSCVHGGTITGTINGNQITFGVVSAEETISYTGTLNGNSMSGSWSKAAQAEPCTATGGLVSHPRLTKILRLVVAEGTSQAFHCGHDRALHAKRDARKEELCLTGPACCQSKRIASTLRIHVARSIQRKAAFDELFVAAGGP